MSVQSKSSHKSVIAILRFNWRHLAWGGALGMLLAGIYLLLAPPKYEATASVMVAHVLGDVVESPAHLVEKLELPGYFSSAVISACGITDRHEPEKVLVKKMKLQVNRNAPFVAISVAAPTATQAEACIAAVIVEIAKRQDEISRPIIVAKQTELADLKIRIETTRAQKNIALNLLLASQRQRQLTGFEAMWMSTATKQEVKLRELIKRTPELEILLTSPLTQPTKLLSPIYAPEVRASMSPWLLLSLSLAAGVLLALVVLVLRVKLPEDNRS